MKKRGRPRKAISENGLPVYEIETSWRPTKMRGVDYENNPMLVALTERAKKMHSFGESLFIPRQDLERYLGTDKAISGVGAIRKYLLSHTSEEFVSTLSLHVIKDRDKQDKGVRLFRKV